MVVCRPYDKCVYCSGPGKGECTLVWSSMTLSRSWRLARSCFSPSSAARIRLLRSCSSCTHTLPTSHRIQGLEPRSLRNMHPWSAELTLDCGTKPLPVALLLLLHPHNTKRVIACRAQTPRSVHSMCPWSAKLRLDHGTKHVPVALLFLLTHTASSTDHLTALNPQ